MWLFHIFLLIFINVRKNIKLLYILHIINKKLLELMPPHLPRIIIIVQSAGVFEVEDLLCDIGNYEMPGVHQMY